MILRRLGVACVLLAGVVGISAPAFAARSLPMQFELRQEGPAETCGLQCRRLISASGAITSDTPTLFHNFTSGRDLNGAVLVLDSDGGSVLGAMALGRQVRALKLATTVGRVKDLPATGQEPRQATLSPRADCESMCAFVLLAGVQRAVPSEARVMVHQIWLGDRRDDPTAAHYSAEDLVLVQRDIGRLARYTAEMGAGIDLLALALRIPPWEPMHALTRDELRLTQLDMAEPPVARAAPATTASVMPRPIPVSARSNLTPEQGWTLISRGGGNVLARAHPLTVEGDEIGSFGLYLACGTDEGYAATYTEERRADDPSLSTPLVEVTLRVGGQTTLLKVASSELRDGVLSTTATGIIPVNLFRSYSGAGSASMMIGTANEKLKTAIRVGNAGVSRSMGQLATRCRVPANARAELAPRTGGMAPR
jgi:hypothetical protein